METLIDRPTLKVQVRDSNGMAVCLTCRGAGEFYRTFYWNPRAIMQGGIYSIYSCPSDCSRLRRAGILEREPPMSMTESGKHESLPCDCREGCCIRIAQPEVERGRCRFTPSPPAEQAVAWRCRGRATVNHDWSEWQHTVHKPQGPAGTRFQMEALVPASLLAEAREELEWLLSELREREDITGNGQANIAMAVLAEYRERFRK